MPRLISQPDKKFSRILLTYPILPELSLEQFMKTKATETKYCPYKNQRKVQGRTLTPSGNCDFLPKIFPLEDKKEF